MHALGNDFIIINNINKQIKLNQKIIKKISNRKKGIGFDQILIVEKSNEKKIDFFYKIFNADGSEIFQCANGARCFAFFLFYKKITKKKNICIKTKNSYMKLRILKKNNIEVNIGKPIFNPKKIPFITNIQKKTYKIKIKNKKIKIGVVSLGNPHCVIEVSNVKKTKINIIGKKIENHYLFPEKVNVSFMQILDKNNIILRVYERGVGETSSCGSAACASVAIGIIRKKLSSKVKVMFKEGNLYVKWKNIKKDLFMTGPVKYVYDGCIKI